ncbi:YlbE-like family protein [Litchfieldia salsa]|uniref:YlbE-like protein n=1 Tax=Litchfieldia salsa TaxID=930152 RepID=A0A1H0RGA9_9BACI|nr:YlbE-like family protein [Litchfieldia salsa]SDP28554.1 YlbE-like protein [Litchfieldia salsa]
MRRDVLEWLQANPQMKQFVRSHPIWYRKLTRYPNERQQLEIQTKDYFKQTWPHKVGKISNGLEFASMMMQMYGAMRKSD